MAQRFYLPRQQVFTDLGVIGAGWLLYTYETGTTTPLATYSDTSLSVANTNPIVADSAGRLGDIFVDDLALYKVVLTDDEGNTIWTADPVDPKVFSLNDFDPRPTSFWGTTAGTADAFTLTADPEITTYSSTQTFFFACHLDNNASCTMAIDDLSALTLKKFDGEGSKIDLEDGDVQAGQTYEARNDGTDIIILNPEITEYARLNKVSLEESTATIDNTGAITYNTTYMVIDGEGAAADTLTTINGGTNREIIIISISDANNDITIDTSADNIVTSTGTDVVLDDLEDKIAFQYDGSNWVELFRAVGNDFLSSKTANGYTYLPNGLIFQWGNATVSADTTSNVNLPITYPTSHLNCNANGSSTNVSEQAVNAYPTSTSQIRISNGQAQQTIYFQSIGY